jgi:AcrR family transcriptional regulator
LDVAAELLCCHGYRRVTIEDVARGADIGKGTVYLHWRTREELFAAVIEREVRAAAQVLMRALEADEYGFLPHRVAPAYFLAVMDSPLLRGFLLADDELLGRLAHASSAGERHQLLSRRYFEVLVEHRLLHEDLSPAVASHAFLAILEGFLRAEANGEPVPAHLTERADVLAVTVQRALETGRRLQARTRRQLAREIAGLFRALIDAE